jgi:hypothetical protein
VQVQEKRLAAVQRQKDAAVAGKGQGRAAGAAPEPVVELAGEVSDEQRIVQD